MKRFCLWTFSKTFGKFKATVRGNFNYSKFNQFIQDSRSINENYTQTYRVGLSTNFREAPNFDIGYRYTIQIMIKDHRVQSFILKHHL